MHTSFNWAALLFNPVFLVFLIPILAILVGGITTIVKQLIKHRERMAMIEQGMNPDWPAPNDPVHHQSQRSIS